MARRPNNRPPRIAIIGGGFGGAYTAQRLERLLKAHEAEIVLLDRNNYFVFYPLLVEAGTSSLEPRHAVVSIRSFLGRTRFIQAEVDELDTEAGTISYGLSGATENQTLRYDHVVLAPGSTTRMPDIPGLSDFGFEIKSLEDAVRLRDHAIRQLELADAINDPETRRRLLHFVIVGANFTGVEIAGEFEVFMRRECRLYPNLSPDDVTMSLVEIGSRILPALDDELSQYAASRLQSRGITIDLGVSVSKVEANRAHLDDGRVLESQTVIWCAGIAPPPLVNKLNLPTDPRGYILCDRDLRVRGYERVWAVGDAAVNPDSEGAAYPATAQHAVQQAHQLAKNLSRVLRGQSAQPCDIKSKGALAALGCRTGVAKVLGIKLSGFPAWFLWRTVYLFKMPGWARRLRVALDWTMDLIFPPDPVQLGFTGSRSQQRPKRNPAPGDATAAG
jgi:NADH dehydrogenase